VIRVIKHFKNSTGEVVTKSFRIRRQKVLDALRWLKKYSNSYKDIEIDESNLDWMGDNHEAELPVETMVDIDTSKNGDEDDLGPSPDQVHDITNSLNDFEPCFGNITEKYLDLPKEKDNEITEEIQNSVNERSEKKKKRDSTGHTFQKNHTVNIHLISNYSLWLFRGFSLEA
jgi:hypothetical protein